MVPDAGAELAVTLDDLSGLTLDGQPREAIEASDALRLLAGRREIAGGNDIAALAWLAPVKPASVVGLRARMEIAAIHERAGRTREAVRVWRSVASADTRSWERRDWAIEVQERAILAIARTYLSLDRPEDALEYLALIPPDGPRGPEAVAVRARLVLGQGEALWSLGLLADLRRPPRAWTADAEVVEVLGLLDACPTIDPAKQRIDAIVATWTALGENARGLRAPLPDGVLPRLVLRDHEVQVANQRGDDGRVRDALAAELASMDAAIIEARRIGDELGTMPAGEVVRRHAPPVRKTRRPSRLFRDRGEDWPDEVGLLVADPDLVCR